MGLEDALLRLASAVHDLPHQQRLGSAQMHYPIQVPSEEDQDGSRDAQLRLATVVYDPAYQQYLGGAQLHHPDQIRAELHYHPPQIARLQFVKLGDV